MKKIISWVAGSFFRQAGRFLFFIVIGGLIFLLIQHNDIQFKWTDLLGIETVKADTYIQGVDTPWYYSDKTTALPRNSSFNYVTQTSTLPNAELKTSNFFVQTPFDISNIRTGYWTAPFYVQAPAYNIKNTASNDLCTRWEQSGTQYSCTQIQSSALIGEYDYVYPQLVVQVIESYQNGYTDICEVDLTKNMIKCPVASSTSLTGVAFVQVRSIVYYDNYQITGKTYYVGLGRKINKYSNDTTSIINNQNQIAEQQEQQHNETMSTITDTNTTSDSDNTATFFNETNTTSESALTSIVSAPVSLINNLVVGSHDSICATLNSKQICLPSGDIIWNRGIGSGSSGGSHGGSGVQDNNHWFRGGTTEQFITFFNLVVGGFILYKCLLSLFNSVHKLLDPADSWVGVMRL